MVAGVCTVIIVGTLLFVLGALIGDSRRTLGILLLVDGAFLGGFLCGAGVEYVVLTDPN